MFWIVLQILTTPSTADFFSDYASDFKEAVKECNNTHYGLQSGIFTKDLNKAFYAFEHMEVITRLHIVLLLRWSCNLYEIFIFTCNDLAVSTYFVG